MVRVDHDANRARNLHLPVSNLERPADCFHQSTCQRHTIGKTDHVFHEQHELVTTDARDRVAIARDAKQSQRCFLEHAVPRGMTQGVIHRFEAVQVNEQHR